MTTFRGDHSIGILLFAIVGTNKPVNWRSFEHGRVQLYDDSGGGDDDATTTMKQNTISETINISEG